MFKTMWGYYRGLRIKVRLGLLGLCYSISIIAALFLGQEDNLLLKGGIVAVLIVFGAISTWVNIKSIIDPITRNIGYLQTMAKGDLSLKIVIKRNTELSKLLLAMRELQESMRTIIGRVQSTAGNLSAASEQLTSTATEISKGTGHASAQSSSVSLAVEEMASVSAAISENCVKMSQKAAGTDSATRKGEEVIVKMTAMMTEVERMVIGTMEAVKALGANSERIGDIIVTIEDIADQTNLLALNAAIEAARAGDQGRGFAVVADEVRNLAERTTSSTREIQSIIASLQSDVKNVVSSMEQSASCVKSGATDVMLSSEAIGTIKSHIGPLTDYVAQVATSAEEQSATSTTITDRMHEISNIIQSAATGANDTEGAASELARCAAELQEMVSRFKVAS